MRHLNTSDNKDIHWIELSMARPKGTADLAPMIRGAAMRALKHNENRGKGLTDILAQSFVDKPLETLTALAKFNPSQSKLDVTHKVEIADIIALAQQRQAMLKDVTPKPMELEVEPRDYIDNVDESRIVVEVVGGR